MSSRKLSWPLTAAGIVALFGIALVFLVLVPEFGLWAKSAYPELQGLFWPALAASVAEFLLYGGALAGYFRVVRRIGRSESFTRENAQTLLHMAWFLGGAAGVWLISVVTAIATGLGPLWLYLLLMAMASGALAVLAWGLSRLVAHAAQLQEESDLTV